MTDTPVISHDATFKYGAVDQIATRAAHATSAQPNAALGALAPMVGTWKGTGFNTIFRPLNPKFQTNLPVPPLPQDKGGDPPDNILELNVTTEKLTFTRIEGDIPNRGTIQQDISLAGMTYMQQINDSLTNTGIHLEPGIWIAIPEATGPGQDVTVARMASIPHGTTINAQGRTRTFEGPPTFERVDITPSLLGGGPAPFRSQKIENNDTARLPQDLTQLAASKTITQSMLDDPNSVLRDAIANQKIIQTTEIKIVADGPPPPAAHGGGTANIDFLVNDGEAADTIGNPKGPNANAVRMEATFWIETVEVTLVIPPHKFGSPPIHVPFAPGFGHAGSGLLIDPARDVSQPTKITFHFKQLQYTQNVFLNFNGLRWPHVSVATLRPSFALPVPSTAW